MDHEEKFYELILSIKAELVSVSAELAGIHQTLLREELNSLDQPLSATQKAERRAILLAHLDNSLR